jgi:hypothetical protein
VHSGRVPSSTGDFDPIDTVGALCAIGADGFSIAQVERGLGGALPKIELETRTWIHGYESHAPI